VAQERADILDRVANRIAEMLPQLAKLESEDSGKPLACVGARVLLRWAASS
jgi:acyl-CoA reductase-like NAD-dependent aldehyde dehydrogenase